MQSFWRVSVSRVLAKFFFILVCGYIGSLVYDYFGWYYPGPINWLGIFVGLMAGGVLVSLEYICRRIPARYLISAVLAGLVSLLAVRMFHEILMLLQVEEVFARKLTVSAFALFSYVTLWILLYTQEEYQFVIPFVRLHSNETSDKDIILDTSVIIDGRIADMCNTTFLNGRLIIPRFVLKELQDIADSSDPLKRNRGRRGLEVLNRIKENSRLKVKIQDTDFPQINTVDAKLVKLAATINGRVFTNDYNLSKVAELQNVEILNINELANVLKPVVLPGELLEVKIIKEGKESNQGVAYLDDGTMVVVENGRKLVGRITTVVVTSAYQTQAGRMIFAKNDREK